MTIFDALKVLGVNEESVTADIVRAAYLAACKRYHPDLNQAGAEMMKLVNEARDSLKDARYPLEQSNESDPYDYGGEICEALNKIIHLQGIKIEICGSWVWVSGNTKEHWLLFKGAGFRYSPPKKMVYFRPEYSKRRRYKKNGLSIDEIRSKYGSEKIKYKGPRYLQVRA